MPPTKFRSKDRSWRWREWYSLCSKHRDGREDCEACNVGQWVHVPALTLGLSKFVHRRWPQFWMWWANERPFSVRNRMASDHYFKRRSV